MISIRNNLDISVQTSQQIQSTCFKMSGEQCYFGIHICSNISYNKENQGAESPFSHRPAMES